jgi:Tol biopolymer transport system component
VCYTQASQGAGAADLFVFDTADAQARLLLTGGVAHGSTPAWFPDDTRIAYHTAQGQIEVFDSAHGRSEVVTDGEAPAIRADGERIAFRRAHEIFVRDQAGDVQPVSPSSVLAKPHLADGLSWAEDGAHLSFGHTAGLVGKRTDFYLLDVATRQAQKADLDYLSGLILT